MCIKNFSIEIIKQISVNSGLNVQLTETIWKHQILKSGNKLNS